jgi:peptidoglycan/LPS O-acetylase OafA/YrhL
VARRDSLIDWESLREPLGVMASLLGFTVAILVGSTKSDASVWQRALIPVAFLFLLSPILLGALRSRIGARMTWSLVGGVILFVLLIVAIYLFLWSRSPFGGFVCFMLLLGLALWLSVKRITQRSRRQPPERPS